MASASRRLKRRGGRRRVVGEESSATSRRRGGVGEEAAIQATNNTGVMINNNLITKNKLKRLSFSQIVLAFASSRRACLVRLASAASLQPCHAGPASPCPPGPDDGSSPTSMDIISSSNADGLDLSTTWLFRTPLPPMPFQFTARAKLGFSSDFASSPPPLSSVSSCMLAQITACSCSS